ncbi:sister chromatid cohesion protein Dcc1 [Gautieria morchelliformis]|nr:sister chromatid cohesion protein Dcc1 [Gautieria morchelliformis]
MPVEYPLRFAPSSSTSSSNYDAIGHKGSYRLLELPPELCKLLESGVERQFTIRGRTNDDAVLCTASQTYALRAVTLSNTILVSTTPSSTSASVLPNDSMDMDVQPRAASELIVRDELSQILELVPAIPKLHRMRAILKGCEYDEGHERDEDSDDDEAEDGGGYGEGERPRKRARYTKDTIRGEVQASDMELREAFRDFHILEIDGHLRPLSTPYLTHILEALLTSLISQRLPLPPARVPVQRLVNCLESELDMELGRGVVRQVMGWFGDFESEAEDRASEAMWMMNQKHVVRQIGLGHLMPYKDDPVPIKDLIAQWCGAVGDYFTPSVDLNLLEGTYLLHPAPSPSSPTPTHITYFPSSALPTAPQQLFADLFLTRTRWRAEDLEPFLAGVAKGRGEREKLLVKYARATVGEGGGVWYTARATGV